MFIRCFLFVYIGFERNNCRGGFCTKKISDNRPYQFSTWIVAPKVVEGLVITGDQVISQESQKKQLKESLPEALCVEMEGASVGQVCYEYGVPFTVIRDYADHHHTAIDVKKFVQLASAYYSMGIIENLYAHIRDEGK
jgi:nucleoside phosphorylase